MKVLFKLNLQFARYSLRMSLTIPSLRISPGSSPRPSPRVSRTSISHVSEVGETPIVENVLVTIKALAENHPYQNLYLQQNQNIWKTVADWCVDGQWFDARVYGQIGRIWLGTVRNRGRRTHLPLNANTTDYWSELQTAILWLEVLPYTWSNYRPDLETMVSSDVPGECFIGTPVIVRCEGKPCLGSCDSIQYEDRYIHTKDGVDKILVYPCVCGKGKFYPLLSTPYIHIKKLRSKHPIPV